MSPAVRDFPPCNGRNGSFVSKPLEDLLPVPLARGISFEHVDPCGGGVTFMRIAVMQGDFCHLLKDAISLSQQALERRICPGGSGPRGRDRVDIRLHQRE